ncbi:MAG: glycerol-3-phosphate 1-O-acyltransferase PlsY [Firmicutes bacterium]|nr:glycerol-3-phosphate 1-O-acyltransferase PlsY [Bacillota bacterium]
MTWQKFLVQGFLWGKGFIIDSFGGFSEVPRVVMLLGYLACIIVPYLIGSINSAIIVSKLLYHEDIRQHGSGNAGMTNMFRVYGKKAGLLTLLGDALKALAAVVFGSVVMGVAFGGAYVAGFFCVIGHVFPIFFKFKGGKGVIVSAITILCTSPIVFFILILIFALITGATRYVSLGSVTCAFFYPMVLSVFVKFIVPTVFSILLAVLVIVMHKSNIERLFAGKENKISFHRKDKDK